MSYNVQRLKVENSNKLDEGIILSDNRKNILLKEPYTIPTHKSSQNIINNEISSPTIKDSLKEENLITNLNENQEYSGSVEKMLGLSPHKQWIISTCNSFSTILADPFQKQESKGWSDLNLLKQFSTPQKSQPSPKIDTLPDIEPNQKDIENLFEFFDTIKLEINNLNVEGTTSNNNNNTDTLNSITDYLESSNEDVPSIFFQEDFSIDKEEIFNSIIAKYKVSTHLQQQKLEFYLSIVETSLLSVVLRKSEKIDSIVEIIQFLKDSVDSLLNQIYNEKEILQFIHQELYSPAHRIHSQLIEKEKMHMMHDLLSNIEVIFNSLQLLDSLEQNNSYLQILELIENIEQSVSKLSSISCLNDIPSKLKEKKKKMKSILIQESLNLISIFNNQNPTTNDFSNLGLENRFLSLLKLKCLREVFISHFEQMKTWIISGILYNGLSKFISKLEIDNYKNDSRYLSQTMKVLSPSQLLKCTISLFEEYERVIFHESKLAIFLLNFADLCSNQFGIDLSISETMKKDFLTNLDNIYQFCHSRASLIVSLNNYTSSVSRSELLQIMNRILRFIDISKTLMQKSTEKEYPKSPLEDILHSFGAHYLKDIQFSKIKNLQDCVSNDSWIKATDLSQVQGILNSFIQLSTSKLEILTFNDENSSSCIWINDKSFYISTSTIRFISLLLNYFDMIKSDENQSKFRVWEVFKYILGLISVYNNELELYILGAKAMESTGKAISVNHLVLTSEILDFILQLIPLIESYISSKLDSNYKFLLQDLVNISETISKHKEIIFLKIQEIMKHLVLKDQASWKKLPWANRSIITPTKEIRRISKLFSTMHSKLNQFLLPRNRIQLLILFMKICEFHEDCMIERVSEIMSLNPTAKEVMNEYLFEDIQDFELQLEKLSLLSDWISEDHQKENISNNENTYSYDQILYWKPSLRKRLFSNFKKSTNENVEL